MESAGNRTAVGEKSPRVFEEICLKIKDQVACGQLRTGDKLPSERDLAEKLGTSRSAVREALRSLERRFSRDPVFIDHATHLLMVAHARAQTD